MSSGHFARTGQMRLLSNASIVTGATFHVEHIISRSDDGSDELENLCWACPSCNLHKSDRSNGIDPMTGEMASLFHPRKQKWSEHFQWDGWEVLGLTAVGRATIAVLHLNDLRRQRIREAEQLFKLFPPSD